MNKLLIKKGTELTKNEVAQINQAAVREFKISTPGPKHWRNRLVFLLVDGGQILAIGQLITVGPIEFKGEKFSVLGIGGIIANEKRKGFGRQIMAAIKKHLIIKNKTGVGFCVFGNKGFYEKCDFSVNSTSIKRFVYQKGKKKVTNSGDDCVIYWDGPDCFIRKVLSDSNKEVLLPRPPNW